MPLVLFSYMLSALYGLAEHVCLIYYYNVTCVFYLLSSNTVLLVMLLG